MPSGGQGPAKPPGGRLESTVRPSGSPGASHDPGAVPSGSTGAYLGPPGTFTEEAFLACRRRLSAGGEGGRGGLPLAPAGLDCASVWEVAEAVSTGRADWGVVPLENSLEGSVALSLDALLSHADLRLVGELVLPVRHALVARPGVPLAGVQGVLSHPHALAQCRRYLRENLGQVPLRPAASTAAAARTVARSRRPLAAVAPARAAEIYGLAVLAADIQESPANVTRFGVLGKWDPEPTGHDKTSIAFSLLEDRPGGLHEALGEFAGRGINLTRIESRPAGDRLGHYVFFVDMEGHASDPPVAEALLALEPAVSWLRRLGSYPADLR